MEQTFFHTSSKVSSPAKFCRDYVSESNIRWTNFSTAWLDYSSKYNERVVNPNTMQQLIQNERNRMSTTEWAQQNERNRMSATEWAQQNEEQEQDNIPLSSDFEISWLFCFLSIKKCQQFMKYLEHVCFLCFYKNCSSPFWLKRYLVQKSTFSFHYLLLYCNHSECLAENDLNNSPILVYLLFSLTDLYNSLWRFSSIRGGK